MARTRVWATEESSYTDATLQRDIDNKGTNLRVDVREVVNQLLGVAEGTALADPVVALGGGTLAALYPLGVTQTYTITIPWTHFLWNMGLRDTEGGSAYTQGIFTLGVGGGTSTLAIGADPAYGNLQDATNTNTSTTATGYASLILPGGVTITNVTGYYYRNQSADAVTISLLSHVLASAAGSTTEATIASSGTTTGSMQTATTGTIGVLTSNTKWYQIKAALVGGNANNQIRFYGVSVTYTSPTANNRI